MIGKSRKIPIHVLVFGSIAAAAAAAAAAGVTPVTTTTTTTTTTNTTTVSTTSNCVYVDWYCQYQANTVYFVQVLGLSKICSYIKTSGMIGVDLLL